MDKVRIINTQTKKRLLFSICTVVNDEKKYMANQTTWKNKGFHGPDCEYLICDNRRKNQFDGFQATRMFLDSARGHYVILSDLDSRPLETKQTLQNILGELEHLDPRWAVVGNAGVQQATMRFVTLGLRMPGYPKRRNDEKFCRVEALDENLLIVKGEARLSVSHDLKGFHLYGMDLCDVARRLGRTCTWRRCAGTMNLMAH